MPVPDNTAIHAAAAAGLPGSRHPSLCIKDRLKMENDGALNGAGDAKRMGLLWSVVENLACSPED